MTDMLAWSAEWLRGTLRTHVSQRVAYHRGSAVIQVPARLGTIDNEEAQGEAVLQARTRDFLVDVKDLRFGGQRVEPAEGDLIKWYDDSTLYTYEVVSDGVDGPFRLAGPHRKTYRIHTQLITSE